MKKKLVISLILALILIIALCPAVFAAVSVDDHGSDDGGDHPDDDGGDHHEDDSGGHPEDQTPTIPSLHIFGGGNLQDLQLDEVAEIRTQEGFPVVDENGNLVYGQLIRDENGNPLIGPYTGPNSITYMYYFDGQVIYISTDQTQLYGTGQSGDSEPVSTDGDSGNTDGGSGNADGDSDRTAPFPYSPPPGAIAPPDSSSPGSPDSPVVPPPEVEVPQQRLWAGAYGTKNTGGSWAGELTLGEQKPVHYLIGEPLVDVKDNPVLGRPVIGENGKQLRNSQGWPVWVVPTGTVFKTGTQQPPPPPAYNPNLGFSQIGFR